MKKKFLPCLLLTLVFLVVKTQFVYSSNESDYKWTGPGKISAKPEAMATTTSTANTNWSAGATWSGGSAPATGDNITVNTDVVVNTNITISNGTLTVNAGETLLDAAGGTAYTMDVKNASTVDIYGNTTFGGAFSLENTSTLHVHACCTLTVGSFTVKNSTSLTLDACAYIIVTNGNFSLENTNSSTINGTVIVQNGNVTANNSATVSGTGYIQASGSITSNNTSTFFGNSGTDCTNSAIDCYAGGGIVGPLPIELIYFDALPADRKVDLAWATASETNNNYFTIERSSDGLNFVPVFNVVSTAPNGNSSSPLNYTAVDEQPLKGKSYYRLKQTDFDNSTSYSEMRLVDMDGNLLIYPNPLEYGSLLTYIYPGDNYKNAEVNIYDATGKKLFSTRIEERKNTLQMNLPAGLYFVEALGLNESFRKTLVVR